MTPVDAVKLCYQSAFGCGHLVKNKDFALSMLKKELDETKGDFGAQLFEPIGGGYVRLDLHKAKAEGILEEKIAEIFMESANFGEKTKIEPKLELLKKLAKEGRTPFSESSVRRAVSLRFAYSYSTPSTRFVSFPFLSTPMPSTSVLSFSGR